MKSDIRLLHTLKTASLLVCALLISTGASAATSYLQELEAEAAATDDNPQSGTPAAKPNWQTQQTTTASEKLEPGLSKAKFEESLKSRFYGSYVFYSNLNEQKQQVVYEEYQNNSDIEHLREVIKAQLTN